MVPPGLCWSDRGSFAHSQVVLPPVPGQTSQGRRWYYQGGITTLVMGWFELPCMIPRDAFAGFLHTICLFVVFRVLIRLAIRSSYFSQPSNFSFIYVSTFLLRLT